MLAIHGLWSPGRGVLLWAEDGERPATSTSRSLRTARPHPFAAPAAALYALHPGKPTTVTLLLPSRPHGPLPSPELVRTGPAGGAARTPPALRPWSVPALQVDASELTDPADEARYGASVAHLRALATLAEDLAERGRVLPTLDRVAGAALARWRPVLQGVDRVRVEQLVAALPPVGRAELVPGGAAVDPQQLVDDALAVLVDARVRDRLAAAPQPISLVPPRRPGWPRCSSRTRASAASGGSRPAS